MSDLGIFGLEFENNMSYLKSAPSNLSNWKNFVKEKKLSKFGTENALFGYFWAGILKKVLTYLKSTPSQLSKMSF